MTIRTIFQPVEEEQQQVTNISSLSCAYHITNAFSDDDLQLLQQLRQRLPLDVSRPTCPRRFVTEKQQQQDGTTTTTIEDGWIGQLIDRTIAISWKLPFQSLPWFRFLEYTKTGSHMDRHTDGSNVHPVSGERSIATMLIYLSTCYDGGGATTLYVKKKQKKNKQKNNKGVNDRTAPVVSETAPPPQVVEHVIPAYNTALIFPHTWPHSGDPVLDDHKICLRVDLTRRSKEANTQ